MIKIDINNALTLQKLVIDTTGGSSGTRDCTLLDSALNTAYQTFEGNDLYPTIEEKGARLGFNLVSNHAFIDGNKRIGLLVMLTFLEINGIKLSFTDNELVEIGLSLASGNMSYESLLKWIKVHIIDF